MSSCYYNITKIIQELQLQVEEKKKQRDPHNKAPKKTPAEVALNVSGGQEPTAEEPAETPQDAPAEAPAEDAFSPEIEGKEEEN